ncbi:MAG: hypothetical protein HZA59_14275 [Hydrogenophilales bacterium]|nr:hypothetical protein [Hydrogenophilales bacterium]
MHSAQQQTLRGVQPSYVTDKSIILCKSSPSIENTYEIRLSLYFAVKEKKTFELRVPPKAVVAPTLSALIAEQGGRVSQRDCSEFTVTFTHFDKNKKEKDSWVLGDRAAWDSFHSSLRSTWLRAELKPGASFSSHPLQRFKQELIHEAIPFRNIDDESIQQALQRLIQECESDGGYILVQ